MNIQVDPNHYILESNSMDYQETDKSKSQHSFAPNINQQS